MQVLKGFRYRVYDSDEQRGFLRRIGGGTRFVRNLAREQCNLFGRRGRWFSYEGQAAELKALKEEAPFLKEIPHHCLQQALVDLNTAYKRFFAKQAGYPRRARRQDGDSFRFPDPKQFRLEPSGDGKWALLRLPKMGRRKGDYGPLRLRLDRPLPGKPRSVTISFEGDHCYASILCAVEIPTPVCPAGPRVGVDLGVAVPIMRSDGVEPHVPIPTKRQEERRRRLKRALSRKQRGSRNRVRARRALARHEAARSRRRRDALHKATSALAKNHGVICIEDLRVKAMTASARGTVEEPGSRVAQKAGLNRAILSVGWGQFRTMLTYKAGWYGSEVVLRSPAHTSQTCSVCWRVNPASRVSRDLFRCTACGHTQHADLNAARVIRGRNTPEDTHSGSACGALSDTTASKQEVEAARPGNPVIHDGV